MALSFFHRPDLPYTAQSLQNSNRFVVLTRALNTAPTDIMLDSELNKVTDSLNILDAKIEDVTAGILPGVNDPNNANFVVFTDGTNQGWKLITDINVGEASVSGNKLIESSVTNKQIALGTIKSDRLAPSSVATTNIIDLNVTTGKIALLAVTAAQIANNTITLDQIANNTITTNQIDLAAAITGTQLAAGANILGSQLSAAAAIVGTQLAAGANILGSQLSAAAGIVGTQLANNTITPTQISPTFASTKATQIAATSSTVYTNPAIQQNHPSAAKFFCSFNGTLTGTNPPISGYNVTSVTRGATGSYTINFTTPFSSINYIVIGNAQQVGGTNNISISTNTLNVSFCNIVTWAASNASVDPGLVFVIGYGTQ